MIDPVFPIIVGFISPSVERRFSKGGRGESDDVLYFIFMAIFARSRKGFH